LTARFGNESARLIHSVGKNLYVVIGLIASIAVLSIMNILGVLDYFSSNGVDRTVDVILLLVLIGVLVPLVLLLLRSRKVLDRWTEMFERNTITTAMSIAMTRRGKEEAIRALAQSVEEIS
jgi:RsiW-degrading membrane proteinase PrsW (M82 family)